jgi:hypothetical protein
VFLFEKSEVYQKAVDLAEHPHSAAGDFCHSHGSPSPVPDGELKVLAWCPWNLRPPWKS